MSNIQQILTPSYDYAREIISMAQSLLKSCLESGSNLSWNDYEYIKRHIKNINPTPYEYAELLESMIQVIDPVLEL